MSVDRFGARERAVAILYQAAIVGRPGAVVLGELEVAPDPYAAQLVRGVSEHEAELDALISRFLRRDWRMERLALLDRIILRLASYELGHEADVPTAVVIDQAVELAKMFSTEQAPPFINGVLRSVAGQTRGARSATLSFSPSVRPTLSGIGALQRGECDATAIDEADEVGDGTNVGRDDRRDAGPMDVPQLDHATALRLIAEGAAQRESSDAGQPEPEQIG